MAGTGPFALVACVYRAMLRRPRVIGAILLALLAGGPTERGIRVVVVKLISPVVRTESDHRAAPESVLPAATELRISVPSPLCSALQPD